jgi:glycine dehydrogenase subunit 2
MLQRLKAHYYLPYERICQHEFVISAKWQKDKYGVKALDIAKRLIDYGFHPPTIYFPLIVEEALMIEPTETESKETLDAFCDAMIAIAKECETDPDLVKNAPHTTPVKRLDETRAARQPVLKI